MNYWLLKLVMLVLKWEKGPNSKEMIRAKTGEYIDRAEKSKAHHLTNAEGKHKWCLRRLLKVSWQNPQS